MTGRFPSVPGACVWTRPWRRRPEQGHRVSLAIKLLFIWLEALWTGANAFLQLYVHRSVKLVLNNSSLADVLNQSS